MSETRTGQAENIGPYAVRREIGRGGMGVVYLARDERLGRNVALKTLSPELVNHPQLFARFEREARALAALDHPNVASIYGLEEVDTQRYLVLEYVAGEPLAQRLTRGPLEIEESLELCLGIASGIEAAHEAGVVHRDLKPGNVVINEDGRPKVLDFGLAKTAEREVGSEAATRGPDHQEPTDLTATGTTLGTFGYMSPEQLRGRAVDRRTDIWSFGCVLYECLSGSRPFSGETASERMAATLEREPDWSDLPERTPRRVRDLLEACLAKDPQRRLRDIGDARLEIERALRERAWIVARESLASGGAPRPRWPLLVATFAGGLLVASALWWGVRSSTASPSRNVGRFSIDMPEDVRLETTIRLGSFFTQVRVEQPFMRGFAVSPDGRQLAFVGDSDRTRIYLRRFDEGRARPLAGTEDGWGTPIFSPDGGWVAFFHAQRGLLKVPVFGGDPVPIVGGLPAGGPGMKGCWLPDGTIVLGSSQTGLFAVAENGGAWQPLTELEPEELGHFNRNASLTGECSSRCTIGLRVASNRSTAPAASERS